MVTVLHDSPKTLDRIDELYLFVSCDETGEGVIAAPLPGIGTVPLMAADKARLESIRPIAKQLAELYGTRVKLVKFTARVELETFDGSH